MPGQREVRVGQKFALLALCFFLGGSAFASPLSFEEYLTKVHPREAFKVAEAGKRPNVGFRLSVPLNFELAARTRHLHDRTWQRDDKYRQVFFALEAYWKELIHRLKVASAHPSSKAP